MKNPILYICIAGLLLVVPVAAQESAKNCAVTGVVLKAGRSEPIRRAMVTLASSKNEPEADGEEFMSAERTAKTDGAGHFEFKNLSCGDYTLSIEKNGYTRLRITASRTWQESISVTLASTEEQHLAIELESGVAISGRVIDEEGEPVAKALVSAEKTFYVSGQHSSVAADSATTDDRGEYRLFGLPPGRYFVKAELATRRHTGYGAVYYPDARSMEQAVAFTLKPGGEARADIRFVPSRLVRVSGNVVGLSDGEKASVALMTDERDNAQTHVAVTQGAFKFDGVVPGNYRLVATRISQQEEEPVSRTMADVMFGEIPLKVGGANLDSVEIAINKLVFTTGRGQLLVKPEEAPHSDLSNLRIMLMPDKPGEGMERVYGQAAGAVQKDGTVEEVRMGPGTYRLVVVAAQPGWEDYYTKSVQVGGRDVTDKAFEVLGSEPVSYEVVLASDGASIDGIVSDESGAPIADAMVVGVPQVELRGQSDLFQTATSDASGRFRLRGIKPGSYTLYAWNMTDEGKFRDPEFLHQFENQGTSISVDAGDHKSQALKLLILDQY